MLCHNISALYGRLKDTASSAPRASEPARVVADEQLSKPAQVSNQEREGKREITAETFPCPVLWENLLLEWLINIDQQILLFGVRRSAFGRTCLLTACWKKQRWHQNITPSFHHGLAQSTSSVEVLCQISLWALVSQSFGKKGRKKVASAVIAHNGNRPPIACSLITRMASRL